jgi:hypothetical protein
MDKKVELFYQLRGKEIVDALYDKGYLNQDVKRSEMRDVEDYISSIIQLLCEISNKTASLVRDMKGK